MATLFGLCLGLLGTRSALSLDALGLEPRRFGLGLLRSATTLLALSLIGGPMVLVAHELIRLRL